jgi:transcription termination/antitermination protein NusG
MADEKAKPTMSWYTLGIHRGSEAKVKEYIEAEIRNDRFNGRVSQVFVPTEKIVQVKNGKRKVSERVKFKGYVFVEAELDDEVAHILRHTPNALRTRPGIDNLGRVSQEEMNAILGKVDDVAAADEEEITFIVGEPVKVSDGPFSGFSGTVDKVDADRRKLTVKVKVFGRETGLDLSFSQVVKE